MVKVNILGKKQENKKENGIKQAIFTKETLGVVTILFATLCLVCLITRDKVFSVPGELVNSFLFGCFGVFAYLVDVWLIVLGIKALSGKPQGINKRNLTLFTLFMICVAFTSHVISMGGGYASYGEYLSTSYLKALEGGISTCSASGIISAIVVYPFYLIFGVVGSAVVFGLLGALSAFFFIRNVVDQNSAVAKKGSAPRFRSTYKGKVATENLGVEVSGVKEYPIENAVPIKKGDNPSQKLFINNEDDFAFMTKKEKSKDETHITIDVKDGGINVSKNTGSYTKNYVEDINEKIAYIKTPKPIDVSGVNNNNGYYNTGVSTVIPRTPEPVKPVETTEETVKPVVETKDMTTTTTTTTTTSVETETIPFIEHEEDNKPTSTAERARSFYERYAGVGVVKEDETTEETQTTVETETIKPVVDTTTVSASVENIEEDETIIPIIDETNEGETETHEPTDTTERNIPIIEETEETEEIEEEDETFGDTSVETTETIVPDEPPTTVVRESRVREILLGDDDNDNGPAYTSRVNADGNGRGEINLGRTRRTETTEVEPPKPIEPEKPKKEIPPINRKYFAPPLDLLETYAPPLDIETEDHEGRMEIIRKTLEDFHITVTPVSYIQGPTITRYEISVPSGMGISVKRIPSCDSDLKMRLSAKDGVRIEAPIPGKDLVGIEVANKTKVTIGLKEVLEASANNKGKPGSLIFALGKDLVGNAITDNLAKAPHYLVAGATGSGKSVCLNVMIVSLIMRYSPEELRLILVDPKSVEFRVYEHIPHLMIDEIITGPQKTLAVLTWAYEEMERRNKTFRECGTFVVDIDGYNSQVASDTVPKMPRIVIIIDELADLMQNCKKELEARICALAQKARSAGIHLVLATQRPSVNVITGTIKANLPARIAFKVMNYDDSRTILSEGGAEKLLGNGDMLYKNSVMPNYERYQGAFINMNEVHSVVSYIRDNNKAYFDDDLTEYLEKAVKPKVEETTAEETSEDGNELDDFFLGAVAFAINAQQISISQIQRRKQMGYARAGGLIDKMERYGFISGFEGSKARKVLITREEFEERFGPLSNYEF